MKNRAHHEGLKCSPYEAVFGKPLKVGLKTSNLPDKAIKDIQTEEELQEIVSAVHDLTETTMQEQSRIYTLSKYVPGDTDDEAVRKYEIQRETDEIQMEMHAASQDHRAEADRIDFDANDHEVEQLLSPSIVSQRQFNIILKRKNVKCNLEAQAFRMTGQTRKKFLLQK